MHRSQGRRTAWHIAMDNSKIYALGTLVTVRLGRRVLLEEEELQRLIAACTEKNDTENEVF